MILAAIQMNLESAPMSSVNDGFGVDATDFGVSRATLGIYAADLGVATDRALGNRRGGLWGFARIRLWGRRKRALRTVGMGSEAAQIGKEAMEMGLN